MLLNKATESNLSHNSGDKRVHASVTGISLKVYVRARPEFELGFFVVVAQHIQNSSRISQEVHIFF